MVPETSLRTVAEAPAARVSQPTPVSSRRPDQDFEFYLETTLRQEAGGEPSISVAFQPEYRNDFLTLRFNIDPFLYEDFSVFDTARGTVKFITRHIDEVSLDLGSFTLEIGEGTIVPADPFGVRSAITGSFEPNSEALRFRTDLDAGPYSHTITYSDISLTEDTGYFTYDGSFTIPFGITAGLGLLGTFDHTGANPVTMTPEVYMHSPIISGGDISLSILLASAFKIGDGEFTGWGISLGTPLLFDSGSVTAGLAYTSGDLHYGEYLNGYATLPQEGNMVLGYVSALLEFRPFDLVLDLQLPFDTEGGGLAEDSDYFALEISTDFFGIALSGGFRTRGLLTDTVRAWEEWSQAFVSLGYSNEAISTTFALHLGQDLTPELDISATLGGGMALLEPSPGVATSPGWMSWSFSTGYSHGDGSSVFIRPEIAFSWNGRERLALRVPLQISLSGDGTEITAGEGSLNFGLGAETGFGVLWGVFTDTASFIETLDFGEADASTHFTAAREAKDKGGQFRLHKSFTGTQPLSLDTTIDIAGRGRFALYMDNLEMPRVSEISLTVTPMGENGPGMTISSANDVKIAEDSYEAAISPRFSITQAFPSAGLAIEFFANTHLEFGPSMFDSHFSESDLSFAAGGTVNWSAAGWALSLSGGVNAGAARQSGFDCFTFAGHGVFNSRDWLDSPTPFASAYARWEGYGWTVGAGYSVDSFPSLLTDESQDMLSAIVSWTGNDFTFSAEIARRDLAGLFAGDVSVFSDDTLWSVSLEKEFGHLGFSFSAFKAVTGEVDNNWLNVVQAESGGGRLGLSLATSLRF